MDHSRWQSDPARLLVKTEIKQIFDDLVRGRHPTALPGKRVHHGSEGHWLQVQFGLVADANNAPDFKGFELKDDTGSKTTFGDWSADSYLFFSHEACEASASRASRCSKCCGAMLSRSEFLQIFGAANPRKGGRPSWSGRVFPKVSEWNDTGQRIVVTAAGDVVARYDYSRDTRKDKSALVPSEMQCVEVTLAHWKSESLASKLERKFRRFGWFKCVQERHGKGRYVALMFGGPISYAPWLEQVRLGTVFIDSGMYEGNKRQYSQWRASNQFWESMAEEIY